VFTGDYFDNAEHVGDSNKDIAGLHGGQVTLQSEKGKGSEFTLTLPACCK